MIYTGNFDELVALLSPCPRLFFSSPPPSHVPLTRAADQTARCMNVLSTSTWMRKLPQLKNFLAQPREPIIDATSGANITVGYHRRLAALSQFIVLRSGHMCTLQQPNVTRRMFEDFAASALKPDAERIE